MDTIKTANQKQCSISSNMVVMIYCYCIGCKDKATTWYLNGFPDGSTLGQQYNVGEKSTVMLHIYINRHAEPPNVTVNDPLSLATDSGYVFFIILYINKTYLDLEKILSSG